MKLHVYPASVTELRYVWDHGQAERNDDVVMKIQEIKQIFSAVPQKNVSITHKITINASEVMHINLTITKRWTKAQDTERT